MREPPVEAPKAPPHPSEVEAPEWTEQEIRDAKNQCEMMLDGMGFSFRYIDPLREGVCGTPAPIELSSIGTDPPVAIEPPARVTCGLAASLGAWADGVLQTAARKYFDEPITAIRNVASYVCRNRYNAPGKRISEHALANALDIAAFRTESGAWVAVLGNWDLPKPPDASTPTNESVTGVTSTPVPADAASHKVELPSRKPKPEAQTAETSDRPETEPDPRPEVSFMREIHASACELFGTVLGPEANEAHKDHFHFDLAQRNHGNYCE